MNTNHPDTTQNRNSGGPAVLYLAAHPDDLEVMFGHSIAAAARDGGSARVYSLVATHGTAGIDLTDPERRSFCCQRRTA